MLDLHCEDRNKTQADITPKVFPDAFDPLGEDANLYAKANAITHSNYETTTLANILDVELADEFHILSVSLTTLAPPKYVEISVARRPKSRNMPCRTRRFSSS